MPDTIFEEMQDNRKSVEKRMIGDILIRETAMLAVGCYAGRVWIETAPLSSERRQSRSRMIWTIGAMLLLVHVLCAFHFRHVWSHAAAWEHTRQRTLELTGWDSGVGLWANYAITMLWLADVAGWWTRLDWPLRHRHWFWFLQLSLAFMMINATAVFGPWYWMPIAAGYVAMLVVCHLSRRKLS